MMSLRATGIPRIRTSAAVLPRRPAAGALVMVIALALVATPALAAMYKWTDANGRVIYSDQPPAGNFKVEAISAPPPPANPNAAKELASKDAELRQKKLSRAEEETKATKARVEANVKRDQCDKIRGQIAVLQSDQNLLYQANAKGGQVYMDNTARRKEREQLGTWIRDNCSP